MRTAVARVLSVALAAASLSTVAARGADSPAALHPPHFATCSIGDAKLPLRCGRVEVFEDRVARKGRVLSLAVVEIDAVHRSDRAVFWNPGGPGGAPSDAVADIANGRFAKELLALHQTHDLVFVDNRGTGMSGAMNCSLYTPAHPELYFAQLFPDAPLRACRARASKSADLSRYTTDISADDLDDVRAAMHYPKIVLDGGSYGTMFYLDYARRHPAHVESLVLQGVAPPGLLLIPLEEAQGAEAAMRALERDCAADGHCRAHFPHFAAHFAALVQRFDAGPLKVSVRNAATKRVQTVRLSKEVFADQLRHTLYDNEGAAYVPYIIEEAYRGNTAPLAELMNAEARWNDVGLALGLNLSVTCAEDLPFITESALARASAGTFQGDTRVRAQQHACDIWNVRRAAASFVQPVRSDAPILMISGADDPATPPQYATEALRYLPNARQIVIPHATHDSESACTDALIVEFVHARAAKHVDGGRCAATAHRPPFAYSMAGFGS